MSVVTAVVAGKHHFLSDMYRSLVDQQLPTGWTWQWVVQEDGDTGIPFAELPHDDPRISTGSGRPRQAATTRTTALSRVHGLLIRAVDADDILPAGALARDICVLIAHPEVAWCVSPALDLLADGSLRPGPRDPASGPLPPRAMANGEQAALLPVVGGTLCTYSDLVRALGGWPALPSAEDVGLLLSVEAVSAGWMLDQPGLIYRKWDGSTSANLAYRHPGEEAARTQVMLDRVEALASTGWRWSPPAYPLDDAPVEGRDPTKA
jgi:hypothetical protein